MTANADNTVITSVCMNRNTALRVSVEEWVKLGAPIVVLDWSSAEPVRETLREYLDKVTVVEVPGKSHFHLSKSKNTSYRAAKLLHPAAEYMLAFDCDVYVKNPAEFFTLYTPGDDRFYTGGIDERQINLRKYSGAELRRQREVVRNRQGTYGTFFCRLSLLESVNMNDERMQGYGVFDTDLFERMRAGGAAWKRIPYRELHHQPHFNRTHEYGEKDLQAGMLHNRNIRKELPKWDTSFALEKQDVILNGRRFTL